MNQVLLVNFNHISGASIGSILRPILYWPSGQKAENAKNRPKHIQLQNDPRCDFYPGLNPQTMCFQNDLRPSPLSLQGAYRVFKESSRWKLMGCEFGDVRWTWTSQYVHIWQTNLFSPIDILNMCIFHFEIVSITLMILSEHVFVNTDLRRQIESWYPESLTFVLTVQHESELSKRFSRYLSTLQYVDPLAHLDFGYLYRHTHTFACVCICTSTYTCVSTHAWHGPMPGRKNTERNITKRHVCKLLSMFS